MAGFGKLRRHSVSRLRHRVALQQAVKTSDNAHGQPVYTWTTVIASLPCAIKTLSGTEADTARQLTADATHRVDVRSNDSINEEMRLVFGSRHLYIGSVEKIDEIDRFMVLVCAEKK